jgi:hypothetical protein
MKSQTSRLRSLEATKARQKDDLCTCFRYVEYHSPEELRAISEMVCVVHNRKISASFIMYAVKWRPLAKEYRHLCTCPPDPMRDFRAGLRPEPTQKEIEETERIKLELRNRKSEEEQKEDFQNWLREIDEACQIFFERKALYDLSN